MISSDALPRDHAPVVDTLAFHPQSFHHEWNGTLLPVWWKGVRARLGDITHPALPDIILYRDTLSRASGDLEGDARMLRNLRLAAPDHAMTAILDESQ